MIRNWFRGYSLTDVDALLAEVSHRPWQLPAGRWQYYQEWNEVLFFHWKVPAELLRPLLPAGLELDLFENEAWISLVPFTMQKISPAGLPPVAFLSDFHEINLRTYVVTEGKPGVYFPNIEAQKQLSVWIARNLSGLPYGKATIHRGKNRYLSENAAKGFHLDVEFDVGGFLPSKSGTDLWLSERYCLYLDHGQKLYRYEIHHLEWRIAGMNLKKATINYQINGFSFRDRAPDLIRYSPGVKVLAWAKKEIKR